MADADSQPPGSRPTLDVARDARALAGALRDAARGYDEVTAGATLPMRLVEAAVRATPAERSSLLLLDPSGRELVVAASTGIERELWPKIRVPLGAAIAGRAAAKGRGLHVRGRADPARFRLLRERRDVAASLVLPLLHEGHLIGVLTLDHGTRHDAFGDADRLGAERLAAAMAALLVRSARHGSDADVARHAALPPAVRRALTGTRPLPERLEALCALLAESAGDGVARVLRFDRADRLLRLAAHSLGGARAGGRPGLPALPAPPALPLGRGLEGGVGARREPLWLRDGRGAPVGAMWPLVSSDGLEGVLCIEAGPREADLLADPEPWDEVTSTLAATLQAERRDAGLRAREGRAAAILELGIALLRSPDADSRARTLVTETSSILEARHAILRVADGDDGGGTLRVRAYAGAARGEERRALLALDKQACRSALRAERAVRVRHLEGGPDLGIRGVLSVALRSGERVLGTLTLLDKLSTGPFGSEDFDTDDEALLDRIGALAAEAWDRRTAPATAAAAAAPAARPFAEELDARIATACAGGPPVTVVTCRIGNLRDFERRDPVEAEQLLTRVRAALEAELEPPARCTRAGASGFHVLLPAAGEEAELHFSTLAHGVSGHLGLDSDDEDPEALRPTLVFGLAVAPDEGRDRAALLEAAALPRMRLV